MVTVTLCLRQERIAPRYDQPDTLMVVDIDEAGQVHETRRIPASGLSRQAICEMVVGMGADMVICGGILSDCQAALARAGIAFIDNVIGSCGAAVDAYVRGRLEPGAILD